MNNPFIIVRIMPLTGHDDHIDIRWYPTEGLTYTHYESYQDAMMVCRDRQNAYPIAKLDYLPQMDIQQWKKLHAKYMMEVKS